MLVAARSRSPQFGRARQTGFTLIEAVADHIIEKLFEDDSRISHISVKIVKLAIAEDGEAIGITMARSRK